MQFNRILPSAMLCAAAFVFSAGYVPFAARASDEVATPTQIKGAKVISAAEGRKLFESKAATFIDTRSVVNFGKGHVPGAVTASYKEKSDKTATFDSTVDSFELEKLPKDKSAAVVFYSDGPTGWKSYKAAVWAVNAGWKNVHYMRGGYADWLAQAGPVER